MTRAYLDHASTTPLRPAARAAMIEAIDRFGDPGRLHQEGRAARVALENAREQVAAFFGARPREVVFTSSGTEAINTALWAATDHVVTTAVEHSSVRDAIARTGTDVVVVGVDQTGRFDQADIIAAVRPETSRVSVQLANHEVGTVQDIDKVFDATRDVSAVLHVDACAAAGHVPVGFAYDLCSVSAHKFGGPPGAGALLVRRGLRVPPLLLGGAQERARRAGLENLPAWIGFGAACEAIDVAGEAAQQRTLIDTAATVVGTVPGITRYGAKSGNGGSLPNLLCIGVDGVEAEPILLALDQHGVATHSGSSCSSETLEPSPVLQAMEVDADHSLRISVGWSSTAADVERFVEVFPGIVDRLRGLRST